MVEDSLKLDLIFGSLADPTRRSIFKRVSEAELTISEIAKHYQMSFAAVAKHLNILEKAHLITKRKLGRTQIVSATPETLLNVEKYLAEYEKLWSKRLDKLEELINKEGI